MDYKYLSLNKLNYQYGTLTFRKYVKCLPWEISRVIYSTGTCSTWIFTECYAIRHDAFFYSDRHIDTISKVNYVLVEHLSNFVNASLNYSIQPSWGYRDNNSKWSGMIGELTRKEAVIGGICQRFKVLYVTLKIYRNRSVSNVR